MNSLLLLIIAFILIPMVFGPFMVKSSLRISARVNINQVSPESLDQNVRTFIDQAKIEFENLGFQFLGYMTLSDHTSKVTSYFGLFRHEVAQTGGMSAVIKHASGRSIQYCEFSNKYSNGRIIDVNNSPSTGVYKNPDKSVYRYSKIRSIKNLYEINNWVTRKEKNFANPVGLEKGRELEMLSDALENEIRLQEKYGYYVLDDNNTQYRLTWKGAFIMTEKQVFPIKNIRKFLSFLASKKAISGMPTYHGK